jgi:Cu/Ag efflux protein CusF
VTIKHGPPKEATNPSNRTFTYDYKVPNATMFNTLQAGDKVYFVADDMGTSGNTWTVTKIEKR